MARSNEIRRNVVFNNFTVVDPSIEIRPGRKRYVLCRCRCGYEAMVKVAVLGKFDHCIKCRRHRGGRDVRKTNNTAVYRGMRVTDHALYQVWSSMIYRCESPTHRFYYCYGARGISVCERWRSDFWAFVDDMGPRPGPKMSLERMDNDGDYEPGNCKWATHTEQMRNRRDPSRWRRDPATGRFT